MNDGFRKSSTHPTGYMSGLGAAMLLPVTFIIQQ
jgi:hypothetical protein